MKLCLKLISWFACACMILLPGLFFLDLIDASRMRFHMTLATIAWFALAPLWMAPVTSE